MENVNRITELATVIAEKTKLVDDYLRDNNLPTPSLKVDAPGKLAIAEDASEIENARMTVIEAAAELKALMLGPLGLLRPGVITFSLSFHNISNM